MKRIIIPALALLLGLTSCNWLERNPKATLAPENYFRDETDLQLFSNSFYLHGCGGRQCRPGFRLCGDERRAAVCRHGGE